nr:ureide permease 1-like isoform X1 [Tanacetum cinerariifolium]
MPETCGISSLAHCGGSGDGYGSLPTDFGVVEEIYKETIILESKYSLNWWETHAREIDSRLGEKKIIHATTIEEANSARHEDIFPAVQRQSLLWISNRAPSRLSSWISWIHHPYAVSVIFVSMYSSWARPLSLLVLDVVSWNIGYHKQPHPMYISIEMLLLSRKVILEMDGKVDVCLFFLKVMEANKSTREHMGFYLGHGEAGIETILARGAVVATTAYRAYHNSHGHGSYRHGSYGHFGGHHGMFKPRNFCKRWNTTRHFEDSNHLSQFDLLIRVFTNLNNWPSVLFAMAGGVVLSLGNLSTQYAWAFVGLSVTEVMTSSITVVIDDKINRAEILFPGVACFLIAVCLGSWVHASNAKDNQVKLNKMGDSHMGGKGSLTNGSNAKEGKDLENGTGKVEKAKAGTAGFLIELEGRRAIKVM